MVKGDVGAQEVDALDQLLEAGMHVLRGGRRVVHQQGEGRPFWWED